MLEMGINSGSKLPSEPIEQGSFATYNRVIEPLGGTCRLALQGTDAEIQSTLNALEELKTGTKKIEFITPFDSYENLMLESYDYRRDGNSGYNVLFVDLSSTWACLSRNWNTKMIRTADIGRQA